MSGNPPHLQELDPVRQNMAIRELFEGRSNAVGTVTLRASQTTTTVTAINCGASSRVFLMPTTLNAAAIVAATYVSSVGQGTFTITHTSNANADKTFFWVALG